MAHVFIVTEETFKLHLEYLFAGTGSQADSIDFLFDDSVQIHHALEKKLVLMLSDVLRIRKGDEIYFFVTKIAKFYGVFEAASELQLDIGDPTYLESVLNKKLTFRIRIKPKEVYPFGVSEYDVLDSTSDVNHAQEMCWSLIYRKLKGQRGCTAITNFESKILKKKLKKENVESGPIVFNNYSFIKEIIVGSDETHLYSGIFTPLSNILTKKVVKKIKDKKAFEDYVQALVIEKIKQADKDILGSGKLTWIGNEVSCGVGMQRIDIVAFQELNRNKLRINVIELKDEPLDDYIAYQVNRYLKWIYDYFTQGFLNDNKNIEVQPICIALERKPTK